MNVCEKSPTLAESTIVEEDNDKWCLNNLENNSRIVRHDESRQTRVPQSKDQKL